jgi:hypothetical protein
LLVAQYSECSVPFISQPTGSSWLASERFFITFTASRNMSTFWSSGAREAMLRRVTILLLPPVGSPAARASLGRQERSPPPAASKPAEASAVRRRKFRRAPDGGGAGC